MRGICSIDNCQGPLKGQNIATKIHDTFEWAATDSNINICVFCGDALLQAIEKELK